MTSGRMSGSGRRIGAMVMRHVYVLRGSWPRMFDLFYWPTVQVALWGLIGQFVASQSSMLAQAGGLFLSAILLWDMLFRCQLGVSMGFMEEMWSRNLGHLFTSPLRPWELVASMFATSLIRTAIGVGGAALASVLLYDFWIVGALGPGLALFVSSLLLFGGALGVLISALIMRLGLAAENLAWGVVFLLQPLSGVFYPIAILPGFLQPVAWLLPSAWVFEAMRGVLLDGRLDPWLLAGAFAANIGWLLLAGTVFVWLFVQARDRGLLLQVGE